MQGFKSFLDKCVLEFGPGITSIVGPNGSGKSNISDALRWVLGEQSAKTLRGNRMEDVIFAGTENRKPVGFAEVSIVIDNTCGTLPLDFNEVVITRRVFRSGEGEYFINKTPCRLKDITEMFLDTGLGRDGYSVIGQGRVEEILSTKSEDRRQIFEEASGIMKYKVRKQEAERKIEQTRQNLIRITDIINELQLQLDPLKIQSEAAKHYLNLRDRLKELEVNVHTQNLSRYREKLEELTIEYNNYKDEIENENNKLNKIMDDSRLKTERQKELDRRYEETRQAYQDINGRIENSFAEIKVLEERIRNIESNNIRLDGEIKELEIKAAALGKETEGKTARLTYLQKEYEDFNAKLSVLEKQLEDILSVLDESERNIEERKTWLIDRLEQLSEHKIRIGDAKSRSEGILKRKHHVESELAQHASEIDRENMLIEDIQTILTGLSESIKQANRQAAEIETSTKSLESKLSELKKHDNSVKTELQYKKSRLRILNEMEQNMEGYNKSVRLLVKACSSDPALGKGVHGVLAKLITVDRRYETALEMALGSALQNIVTESEEEAKKAIQYLRNNKLGRVTFLPVKSVKPRFFESSSIGEIRSMDGFCGIASELVKYDRHYENIISNLLGKVVIIEGLDNAIRMAGKFNYSFKIVTVDGDVLSASGSITGGSLDINGTGILGRGREIAEISGDIERLTKEEKGLQDEITRVINQINESNNRKLEVERLLRDYEISRAKDESRLLQAQENAKKSVAKSQSLKNEKQILDKQYNDAEDEIKKLSEEQQSMEAEIESIKTIIDEHQYKHKEDQSIRDMLHNDITDYKISVNSIRESILGVNENVERIAAERQSALKGIEGKKAEKQNNLLQINRFLEKKEGILTGISKFEDAKSGKVFEIDRIGEERRMIEEEIASTVERISDVNKNIIVLQEGLNRIELRKTKIESDIEVAINRLWEDYELTPGSANELKKDIGSITQAQKAIADLKNKIRELGPVNVGAVEEYKKVLERFNFLDSQKTDLEQSEQSLVKVIQEMTAIMKTQFIEQFKLINSNFNKVFKELFNGGRAELKLIDTQNILESGIDIEVQPPGKKLQNMMLLSGGERALTAIALLFSILLLNPAPFCVLDEIDATLDDANVYRFANYLSKFKDNTQFIMVTHRKGTIESSDAIYGVTMQEHGISNIISMKLDEKAS